VALEAAVNGDRGDGAQLNLAALQSCSCRSASAFRASIGA
jgi:hypothetical protein